MNHGLRVWVCGGEKLIPTSVQQLLPGPCGLSDLGCGITQPALGVSVRGLPEPVVQNCRAAGDAGPNRGRLGASAPAVSDQLRRG